MNKTCDILRVTFGKGFDKHKNTTFFKDNATFATEYALYDHK